MDKKHESSKLSVDADMQQGTHSTANTRPVGTSVLPPARKKKSRKRIGFIIGASLSCFLFAFVGATLAVMLFNHENPAQTVTEFISASEDGNKVQSADEQSISAVVEKVSPSIASIITTSRGGATQGAGTGMIVTADGYIMTNNHVVDGASRVTVILSGGQVYRSVTVVGRDPLNDVAFLKIDDVSGLPAVTIGDSKTVRTGQSVVAIGNALGQYQNTVTSGIVSGLGRPVVASTDGTSLNAESLSDLIQTDAAINSGNSGGPLLNMQGQVIGINTAVAQGANSIGFAIPIGATTGLLRHLTETGEVSRAVIGVQYSSITPEIKAQYNLDVDQGDYLVSSSGDAVQSGGPADRAGVRDRDIITKVNDQAIGPGKSTSTLIGEFKPGDTVRLTILRDGQELTKTVTLGSYGE